MSTSLCTTEDCSSPANGARQMCRRHYSAWRRTHGSANARPCTIEGCDEPQNARGWCTTHYMRWYKTGDVGPAHNMRHRELHHSWQGDSLTYAGAHRRVYRDRGPAAERECACGSTAYSWAYDHEDENELVTPAGRTYSANPAHYVAMCNPCHKRFDLARLASCVGEVK